VLKEQMTLPRGFIIRDPAGTRYVIEGILGKGGSSAVYRVRERSGSGQVFALKEVIDPDRRQREHFIFEWEVLKRLDYPALPKVYAVFEHQKLRRVYILMSYIKGFDLERLRTWQPEKRFSVPMALALMSPVVGAVSYLHHQDPPVVHRDVKPSNILVPPGGDESVLVDFSIAKEYVPNGTTTAVRHGSPGYAAPEQYGTGTTPLTDIYGLGATLYTLLTGAIPTDALTRLTEGKTDPLRSVKEFLPTISAEISAVVARAMSLNREERYANVEEFWQAFRDATREKQASSAEVTQLTTGELSAVQAHPREDITTIFTHKEDDIPVVKRSKVPRIMLALFLLALIAGSILYFWVYLRPTTPRIAATPTTVAKTIPKARPTFSLYPTLTSAYIGQTSLPAKATPGTTVSSPKQPLQFFNIKQKNGNIQGDFNGLAQAGSFSGTVTAGSVVTFKVLLYNGLSNVVFHGNIHTDGSIGGYYVVYNPSGQQIGNQGSWSVNPA
jgi:eukaryotic-like serine/threonine-protein kinase